MPVSRVKPSTSSAIAIFMILVWSLCKGGVGVAADDVNWGCYDPKPGHPTASEREAFLSRLRPVARSVQKEFGVPEDGILSMAVQESGFGWTRTAINANNLFGWKFGQPARDAKLGLPAAQRSRKGLHGIPHVGRFPEIHSSAAGEVVAVCGCNGLSPQCHRSRQQR